MRVVIHVTKYYDWEPVPKDVIVTPADIAAGKVMPDSSGKEYRMKVLKVPPGGLTQRTCTIDELTIIKKIVHEKSEVKRARRTFSRKEAVAHVIQDHLLDDMDWGWIKKIEVHDDGPDEALCRTTLHPYTVAPHARREGMIIPPETVEDHVKAYMEAATADDHVAHLHNHYGVRGVKS